MVTDATSALMIDSVMKQDVKVVFQGMDMSQDAVNCVEMEQILQGDKRLAPINGIKKLIFPLHNIFLRA